MRPQNDRIGADPQAMNSQVKDATLAAIAGLTLGSPHVGRNNFQRLTGYSPIPHRMNPHTSLDTWLIWAKAANDGRPPESLGQILLDGVEDNTEETAYGLMNLRRGFGSPLSGSLDNPLQTGSRALLRSLIWGLIKRDNPEVAARYSFFDASIDHAKEGTWIPTAFAYALAASPVGSTAQEFWDFFTDLLPSESQLHRIAPHIRENIGNPESPQFFANQFATRFPSHSRTGIVASACFVLLGLLHSGQNPEKAMLIAAGCGGQADLVAATTATIASALWGPLPADYISALDDSYIATHSLKHLTPPTTLTEFATTIDSACPEKSLEEPTGAQVVEPITSEVESKGPESNIPAIESQIPTEGAVNESEKGKNDDSDIKNSLNENNPLANDDESEELTPSLQIEDVTESLLTKTAPSQSLRNLLISPPNYTTTELNGIIITTYYIDEPLGAPPVKKLNLSLGNQTNDLKNLKLALTAPIGWEVASRVADVAIPPHTETSFPAVVKPAANPGSDSQLRLQLDQFQLLIPFVSPLRYWLLGPFTNVEGTGFRQEHPPEKVAQKIQVWDQAFSGRSDIGIRWREEFYSGTEFDVEPIFNGGAGTAYLYAHVGWFTNGTYQVQAAYAGGFKLWIDGNQILSYNDSTQYPADHPNYQAEFTTAGESHILIKLVRGRDAIPPLRMTFFDETGRVVFPHALVK